MNDRPTPETDALRKSIDNGADAEAQMTAFARKLEQERDEAQEEAADWNTEYEIVVDRLRGRKHPRDNGIIADDEIIPKLERERDEARESLEEEKKFHHRTHSELIQTQCKLMDVTQAIIATLEENRNLSDGDDCTLAKLKSAVPEWK